jgi:hypothetical protein
LLPAVRVLPWVVVAACGHTPGPGIKNVVDTPLLPFKAPDQDQIADITGIDADAEAALLAGSGSAAGSNTGGH